MTPFIWSFLRIEQSEASRS